MSQGGQNPQKKEGNYPEGLGAKKNIYTNAFTGPDEGLENRVLNELTHTAAAEWFFWAQWFSEIVSKVWSLFHPRPTAAETLGVRPPAICI